MALAMGLPSIIIGVFFGVYSLVQSQIIGWGWALIIILLVVGNTLFLMVRYGMVKKD
ncbi:MAG: hypothetical protein LW878_02430 [Proteobacteria bacterium]|nr:hypothetical protein [Pseudomonadota bacterium]